MRFDGLNSFLKLVRNGDSKLIFNRKLSSNLTLSRNPVFSRNLSYSVNSRFSTNKRFSSSTGDGDPETAHNKTYKNYTDDRTARFNAFNELQIGENASLPEIKQRWLKLSAEMHPDRNPNDPHALERFKKIQEAWSSILENKKMVGGDGPKTYICPDTLEEFKYDIELRPIGLVETTEVHKVDKFHTEPYDGTQNYEVLDPLFNVQLWNPGFMFLERLFYFSVVFGIWAIYSFKNNGIIADYLGNGYEVFDLEEEMCKDDPSEKFKFEQMRAKARREVISENGEGTGAKLLQLAEGEEEQMMKMLEEMGVKK